MAEIKAIKLFLIVQDTFYVRKLDSFLKEFGDFELVVFKNEKDQARVYTETPDVVIMDSDEDKNSTQFKTFSLLRKNHPHIPVLFLSNDPGENEKHFANEKNVSGFLLKGRSRRNLMKPKTAISKALLNA